MNKTRTVKVKQSYIVCDVCESEGIISTCALCGKDVCQDHSKTFNVPPFNHTLSFVVSWSPDLYELTLCNQCQDAVLTAAEWVEKLGASKRIKYTKVVPL